MLVPTKKQTEPVSQAHATAIATRRQTRSMTAEARRVYEESNDRDKELKYYLGLKVSTSRVEALSTPEARAQHAKEVRERVPTSLAKLEEMSKHPPAKPGALSYVSRSKRQSRVAIRGPLYYVPPKGGATSEHL